MRILLGSLRGWTCSNADKALLALLLLIYFFLGLQRVSYSGDGLRHLEHILRSSHPALGEPRWILFPLLIFAFVKPLAAAGLVHSAAQAAKIFCVFDIACAFIYLMCLRRWLEEFSPYRRAAVLLIVGGSSVFLTMATDTIEPTSAAAIAVAGLTFGRFTVRWSDEARLTIAAGALALAGLIYQGILFGFFFLPAIFPVTLLRSRRGILRTASLAVIAPLITITLISLDGDTPWNATRRFLSGEANPAASRQYSRISQKHLAGVAIVGPAYAFATIPELRGLAGSLKLLRQRVTALEAIRGAVAWCCMAAVISAAIVVLLIKKQFAVLFAYGGMMMLPMIRMSQYSYMKYYVLFPLLVVLAVPRIGVRFICLGVLGTLVLLSNLGQIWAEKVDADTLRSRMARDLYPQLPQRSCFLTNGWGPPVSDWRGDSLAWENVLYSGNSESQQHISEISSKRLLNDLKKLFCNCPAVVTDTFTQPNLPSLQQELWYFGIANVPLSKLVIPSTDRSEIFRSPRLAVYRFSMESQRRACEVLAE